MVSARSTLISAAMISCIAALPAANLVARASADPDIFPELQRAAKLSSGAYSACQGKSQDVTITKQINDAATDTQGFVGYSTSMQRISVVMRGSTSAADIANDVDTKLVTPTLSGVNFPSDVQVMHGIYAPWSAVHDDVMTEVKSLVAKYPNYTLESTGHSLGGSLTYLSYVSLTQNFPDKQVQSNALAAFPIGNQAFADFGTAQNGTLRRGNNDDDGVPNMYVTAPTSFVHYGQEFYSSGTAQSALQCTGERDTGCSAGNGQVGVTAGHFSSFGVRLGMAGC